MSIVVRILQIIRRDDLFATTFPCLDPLDFVDDPLRDHRGLIVGVVEVFVEKPGAVTKGEFAEGAHSFVLIAFLCV